MTISRRSLLKATAAASAIGTFHIGRANAQSAEFTYKYANNLPVAHPMNMRANEAVAKIKEETKATVRCIPFKQSGQKGKDIITGEETETEVLFAQAY